jgi:hypothetical protein
VKFTEPYDSVTRFLCLHPVHRTICYSIFKRGQSLRCTEMQHNQSRAKSLTVGLLLPSAVPTLAQQHCL